MKLPSPIQAIKALLGLAVLALLLLPLGQRKYNWWPEKVLHGYQPPGERPVLDWEHWADGSYQEAMDSILNEEIGFHPGLVRMHNQVQWSLFGRLRTRDIVVGKENYLYEQSYIDALLGRDYKGDATMDQVVNNLSWVKDSLAARGIGFGVIIAPSKAQFFPEYIPDSFQTVQRGPTNYEYYTEALPKAGIPVLDFDKHFRQMKDTSPFPLFPKAGIHWSYYGAYLATDSIFSFVEQDRQVELPELILDTIIWSEQNFRTDFDIGQALNLVYQPDVYPMAYPIFHYHSSPRRDTVDVLVIGDSFYFTLLTLNISYYGFGKGQFWYYNNDVIAYPPPTADKVRDLDVKSELEKHDMVMLISTVANLRDFPWTFDTMGRKAFGGIDEKRLEHHIAVIKNSESWMREITEKAAKNGLDVEEQIRADAEWMLMQELSKERPAAGDGL